MFRPLSTIAALLMVVATSHVVAQQGTAAPRVTVPSAANTGLARALPKGGSKLSTILGNALDSTNGQLANVTVRLRDARLGRIVDTQFTDKSGMFAFKMLEPGSYIVEIIANDQTILAASQLLGVQGGAVSAVVKLPFRTTQFAGMMGTATTQAALGVAFEAAATGITALVPTAPISPNQ